MALEVVLEYTYELGLDRFRCGARTESTLDAVAAR